MVIKVMDSVHLLLIFYSYYTQNRALYWSHNKRGERGPHRHDSVPLIRAVSQLLIGMVRQPLTTSKPPMEGLFAHRANSPNGGSA